MAELSPASPRERLVVLDVLRGFALFGVLLGNTFHLYSGYWGAGPGHIDPTPFDVVAAWFINLLVQSKAQTLLTFLFGFGFAAQLIRAQDRGEPVFGLYVRRLMVLLGFGLVHVTLLWWGDVLWTYAVAGFALLAFHKASIRTRVIAAVILTIVPELILSLPGMYERSYELFLPADTWPIYTNELLAAMRGSDHGALLWQQLRYVVVFSAGGVFAYEPWLVGRFLIGYVAGALRWFDRDGADHLPVFRRILKWGALAGAIGITVQVLRMVRVIPRTESVPLQLVYGVVRQLDYAGLAAVYLAATVLLIQRPRWRRLLAVIAPAGRMPLTVYLSQSLIMTGLLYGWGLGWNEVVSPAAYIGIATAVFSVQVALCTLWLRWFRYGPLEWLWRAAVYLQRPPMRV